MNLIDNCIYYKYCGNKYIFLVLYVDSILLTSNDISLLYDAERFLPKNFDMKDLGDISFVLSIQIHHNCSQAILGLSQKSYIEMILNRYDMQDYKPSDTPITKRDKFSLNHCCKNDFKEKEMKKIMYALVVRSLMYAQDCTGSYILYVAWMLGRYLKNLEVDHWKASKQFYYTYR